MSSAARASIELSRADATHRPRSALVFFALVVALSIPFAILGAVTRLQLMPGIPISALGFA
jgi:hypothetical protein